MIRETGGKACSSPGLATGALAKAQKSESWPTSTTVSSSEHFMSFCSLIKQNTFNSFFIVNKNGMLLRCVWFFRFFWQQWSAGIPGFTVFRSQSGAGDVRVGEKWGQSRDVSWHRDIYFVMKRLYFAPSFFDFSCFKSIKWTTVFPPAYLHFHYLWLFKTLGPL